MFYHQKEFNFIILKEGKVDGEKRGILVKLNSFYKNRNLDGIKRNQFLLLEQLYLKIHMIDYLEVQLEDIIFHMTKLDHKGKKS